MRQPIARSLGRRDSFLTNTLFLDLEISVPGFSKDRPFSPFLTESVQPGYVV